MKKQIVGLTGLGALAVVGASWAYFNQVSELVNPMQTKKYNTSVIEHFTPGDGWEPGAEVNKDVFAKNTGDYPVIVRVKLDESWTKKGKTEHSIEIDSRRDGKKGKAMTSVGSDLIATQINDTDGWVISGDEKDESVVQKKLMNTVSDLEKEGWYFNAADGYWYYTTVLEEGEATAQFMDSIALAKNTDMGVYDQIEYYMEVTGDEILKSLTSKEKEEYKKEGWIVIESKDGKDVEELKDVPADFDADAHLAAKWQLVSTAGKDIFALGKDATDAGNFFFRKSEKKLNEGRPGYADSKYELKITTEFVQANADALTAGWISSENEDVIKYLETQLGGASSTTTTPGGGSGTTTTTPGEDSGEETV